ncbi:uncharacterized protein Z519_02031 [Cladophialophora bantiana CBS 173.52]|uniref:Uncharacterized protein n=1 Tax=Cladophialophora bantiana (strain ATCC 10958 / CBS 173.52 / CDC B-1940 / NIH 8579) TaxID=1442370 RepID=A0A0D2I0F2_CLAB1|nr:uncharacterized protein Z519_02031 [Cladophialophora bantiana CBS 173.52]KIW96640.1 hypothetical protein Z519_02031 [Cladophialophora bantiana CBS 173.52]
MTPSSARTPNFSRPLPSPYSTGAFPAPSTGSGRLDVMKELPPAGTMANMPKANQTKELTPSKNPFDTASTRSPHALLDKLAESPGEKRANNAASPGVRHGRKLSEFSSFKIETDSKIARLL